ncbi:MAG: sulfur oxidation c-type cytochrome SoxA [Pseudomonadota bacterium]|jgi:sulfur-oxidizing protein SoxA
MNASSQAMQRDDAQNPGMLWVAEGEQRWRQPQGRADKSCASCHGPVASLARVATRYPAWDARGQTPITLAQRIQQCRQQHQQAPALPPESAMLLALEAVVAHQSRGLPITPPTDARLDAWRAQGQALYQQRMGQLNLACAHCHDQLAGGRLGGAPIVQGHPTGYPLYRLEWQTLGSLPRRVRACMSGVRAEPYAWNAPELTALTLYLMQRASGMPLETPGVRP